MFVQEFSKMGNYSAHLIEIFLLTLDVLGPKCSTPTGIEDLGWWNDWQAAGTEVIQREQTGGLSGIGRGSSSYSRTEETWEVRRHTARANRKLELTDKPTTVLVKLSWQKNSRTAWHVIFQDTYFTEVPRLWRSRNNDDRWMRLKSQLMVW